MDFGYKFTRHIALNFMKSDIYFMKSDNRRAIQVNLLFINFQ